MKNSEIFFLGTEEGIYNGYLNENFPKGICLFDQANNIIGELGNKGEYTFDFDGVYNTAWGKSVSSSKELTDKELRAIVYSDEYERSDMSKTEILTFLGFQNVEIFSALGMLEDMLFCDDLKICKIREVAEQEDDEFDSVEVNGKCKFYYCAL